MDGVLTTEYCRRYGLQLPGASGVGQDEERGEALRRVKRAEARLRQDVAAQGLAAQAEAPRHSEDTTM